MGNANRSAPYIDPDVTLDGVPTRRTRTMQSLVGRVAMGSLYVDGGRRYFGVPTRRVRSPLNEGIQVQKAYMDPGVTLDGVPTRRWRVGGATFNPLEFPFPTVTLDDGLVVPRYIRIQLPCRPWMSVLNDPLSSPSEYIAVISPIPFAPDFLSPFYYGPAGGHPFVCRTYEFVSTQPYVYRGTLFNDCSHNPDRGNQYEYMLLNCRGVPQHGQAFFHELWIEYGIQPDGDCFFTLHISRLPEWYSCPDDVTIPHLDYHPHNWITSVRTGGAGTALHNVSSLMVGDHDMTDIDGTPVYSGVNMPFHHVPGRWPAEEFGRFVFPSNEELLGFFLTPYLVEGWLELVDPRSSLGHLLGTLLWPLSQDQRLALGPFNIAILGADNLVPPAEGSIGCRPGDPGTSVSAYLKRELPLDPAIRCNILGPSQDPCIAAFPVPAGLGKCCWSKYVFNPDTGEVDLETQCMDLTTFTECETIAQQNDADFHGWGEFQTCVPYNCQFSPPNTGGVGACCLPDFGGCIDTTADECAQIYGGTWLGEERSCSDVPPPCGKTP